MTPNKSAEMPIHQPGFLETNMVDTNHYTPLFAILDHFNLRQPSLLDEAAAACCNQGTSLFIWHAAVVLT